MTSATTVSCHLYEAVPVSYPERGKPPCLPFGLSLQCTHPTILTNKLSFICTMSIAPASTMRPGSILDVALAEYRKNEDLLSHQLAIELQNCDSVDDILAILQRQVNTLEQLILG